MDAKDYSKLIDNSDVKDSKIQPVFAYILDETPELNEFLNKVANGKRLAVTKMRAHSGSENDVLPPVELWLKGFRDAELVITNSFHGMLFSVLNNTDFIIISKKSGGDARLVDFLSEFDLADRIINEEKLNDFNINNIGSIDWRNVNKKLHTKKQKSISWLIDNIQA